MTEIERLQEELDSIKFLMKELYPSMGEDFINSQKKNEILVEALRFYADTRNYDTDAVVLYGMDNYTMTPSTIADEGRTAREALEKVKI